MEDYTQPHTIYYGDAKSAYPKEILPKWWQFKEKRHIAKVARQAVEEKLRDDRQTRLVEGISEALRHTQIAGNHTLHHTYAQRPAAERPSRLTIVYVMQDGMEYKEYIPLNGQHYTITAPMHYVWSAEIPPVNIRYEFGYTDGGRW